MYKSINFLVVLGLILCAVCPSYGLVIGDWEDEMDLWVIWDDAVCTTSYSTTGATLNSKSLHVNIDSEWNYAIGYKLQDTPYRNDFMNSNIFSIDVTFVASEWMGGTWANIENLYINAVDVWVDLGRPDTDTSNPDDPGAWDPNNFGETDTRTLTWDYSSVLDPSLDDSGWLEIIIATNYDPMFTTGGSYYFDNAQLISTTPPRVYDYVIGDFEDETLDGWYLDPYAPEGSTLMQDPNQIGVTLNNNSVRLYIPDDKWQHTMRFDVNLDEDAELINVFRRAGKFRMDLTRIASEWVDGPGSRESSGFHFAVNTNHPDVGDGGWYDCGYDAWWMNDDGDRTITVEWDYSEILDIMDFSDLWWLEFFLYSYYEGYSEGGIFHIDNCRFPVLLITSEPVPADGAKNVDRADAVLSWLGGTFASEHDVFFGTDQEAVETATTDSHTGVQYARVSETEYDPGLLDYGTTYYWRADAEGMDDPDDPNDIYPDEYHVGKVWSFTTGNFDVIDDFESYSSEPNIPTLPESWVGTDEINNGITVGYPDPPYVETTIAHGGSQSMPLFYSNPDPNEGSEASFTLSEFRDLSEMDAVSFWYRGETTNEIEPMYIRLSDGDGTSATVTHPDTNAAQVTDWTEWRIALSDFVDVDMSDVDQITIGLEKVNDGTGKIYIDDLRVYKTECVLYHRTAELAAADFAPAGDPAGDCVVDWRELEIFINDWQESDFITPTTNPGTEDLEAYYPFDDPNGGVIDASGSGHDGTILGSVDWVTGHDGTGYALEFDGDGSGHVEVGTWDPSAVTGELTLSVWMKWAGLNDYYQGVVVKRDGWSNLDTYWQLELIKDTGEIGFTRFDSYPWFGSHIPTLGEWMHVAVTFDGTTTTMYIEGYPVGSSTVFSFGPKYDAMINIGSIDNGGSPFNGAIDEVYLYSRALSASEVAYLSDLTPEDGGLYEPIASSAEIYDSEEPGFRKINLNDFAMIAEAWLMEQLWP